MLQRLWHISVASATLDELFKDINMSVRANALDYNENNQPIIYSDSSIKANLVSNTKKATRSIKSTQSAVDRWDCFIPNKTKSKLLENGSVISGNEYDIKCGLGDLLGKPSDTALNNIQISGTVNRNNNIY